VNSIKSLVALASGFASLIAVNQASAEPAQPPPAGARAIAVVYSDKGPSGASDVAMGAYRAPDGNVAIQTPDPRARRTIMFRRGRLAWPFRAR